MSSASKVEGEHKRNEQFIVCSCRRVSAVWGRRHEMAEISQHSSKVCTVSIQTKLVYFLIVSQDMCMGRNSARHSDHRSAFSGQGIRNIARPFSGHSEHRSAFSERQCIVVWYRGPLSHMTLTVGGDVKP